MYIMHSWRNEQLPALSASNLNEMEIGIMSGSTFIAQCDSNASASDKEINITGFAPNTLIINDGNPFVLYILFTKGSTSSQMNIKINGNDASKKAVKYRENASGINALNIAQNDLVMFIYTGGVINNDAHYCLIGSIAIPPSDLISVNRGGTGRSTLTTNALLAGNANNQVKLIDTAPGALLAASNGGEASFGVVPVSYGGTGSADASNARSNLGIPTIYKGTSNPNANTGNNGDLYFKYTT